MRKIAASIVTVILLTLVSSALTITAGATAGGFTVSPILPPNQDPDTRGYFDLVVTPGEFQEIGIMVRNATDDETILLSISAITATTNGNGIINYTDPDRSDETLRQTHSFASMAQIGETSVTLGPGEQRDITITFTIPDEAFDGIILGSIAVLRELTDEDRENAGMIVNRHRHVLAVRIKMSEEPVEPNFLLGGVSASLVNHRAAIVADIRNPQPRITQNVEANAQIYPLGSETPIFQISNPSVAFAPNSVFPFSMVDEAGYGIQAGMYLARIQLHHDDRTWEFEHEFEILAEEADEINQSSVNQQLPPPEDTVPSGSDDGGFSLFGIELTMEIIIAAGAVIALIIGLIVFALLRKSKGGGAGAQSGFAKRGGKKGADARRGGSFEDEDEDFDDLSPRTAERSQGRSGRRPPAEPDGDFDDFDYPQKPPERDRERPGRRQAQQAVSEDLDDFPPQAAERGMGRSSRRPAFDPDADYPPKGGEQERDTPRRRPAFDPDAEYPPRGGEQDRETPRRRPAFDPDAEYPPRGGEQDRDAPRRRPAFDPDAEYPPRGGEQERDTPRRRPAFDPDAEYSPRGGGQDREAPRRRPAFDDAEADYQPRMRDQERGDSLSMRRRTILDLDADETPGGSGQSREAQRPRPPEDFGINYQSRSPRQGGEQQRQRPQQRPGADQPLRGSGTGRDPQMPRQNPGSDEDLLQRMKDLAEEYQKSKFNSDLNSDPNLDADFLKRMKDLNN